MRARVRQLRERPGWPDGPAQPTHLHPATVGAGSGCAAGTSRQQAPGGSWAALPGVQLWTWGPQTGTAGLRRPEQRRGGARRKREARGLGSEVGELSPCSGRGLFLQVLAPAPGLQCHAQLKNGRAGKWPRGAHQRQGQGLAGDLGGQTPSNKCRAQRWPRKNRLQPQVGTVVGTAPACRGRTPECFGSRACPRSIPKTPSGPCPIPARSQGLLKSPADRQGPGLAAHGAGSVGRGRVPASSRRAGGLAV